MTKIPWTDYTWNWMSGCTPVSDGCKNCYAKRMSKRFAGRYGYPEKPNQFDVTIHKNKLTEPYKWQKPRRVFVCSMGDMFHKKVPFKYIDAALRVMLSKDDCIFQLLTKRPERMNNAIDYSFVGVQARYTKHIYAGVSVEDQVTWDQRVRELHNNPLPVRYVSLEPLLEYIETRNLIVSSGLPDFAGDVERRAINSEGVTNSYAIHQLIIGPESNGQYLGRHCDIEWIRQIVRDVRPYGIPIFIKALPIDGRLSKNIDEWPEDLKLQQDPLTWR